MLHPVPRKPFAWIAGLLILCAVLLSPAARAQGDENYADTDPSALSAFNADLEPYGSWYAHPKFGVVWVPQESAVGADFKPYVTGGHWALTNTGDWTWVSDQPFGWIVYHYGRWTWTSDYGWVWIPGREYSNAWVDWRVPGTGDPYLGWAPAPPTYLWFGGSAVAIGFRPMTPYVFCRSEYVFTPYVHRYIVTDPIFVRRIGSSTVRYVPSGRSYGPPVAAARIPRQYVPQSRVAPDPRAIAYARHGATPMPRVGAAPNMALGHHPAAPIPVQRSAGAPRLGTPGQTPSYARDYSSRSYGSPGVGGTAGRPVLRSSGGYGAPSRTASTPSVGGPMPAVGRSEWGRAAWTGPGSSPGSSYRSAARPAPGPTYSGPSRSYSAPAFSAPSRGYASPSYNAPSRSYSSPSRFSSPSFSSRSYSSPGRSYSPPSRFSSPSFSSPSRSYSAPSHSYSAPSRSYSPGFSGGRSGGHAASPRGHR